MRPLLQAAFATTLLLSSCRTPNAGPALPRLGQWRLELDLNGNTLPVTFTFEPRDSALVMLLHNSTETITVSDLDIHGDSISIRMPLFDSEFRGKLVGDSSITGSWHNYLKGPDYRIPFRALAGNKPRFTPSATHSVDLSGTWRGHFSPQTADAYNALGEFQTGPDGVVSGTFMTETGDYRYLEGRAVGDSLLLSSFDGSHAFLFKAVLRNDTLHGDYLSGTHWREPWFAVRDASYSLRDPDSLTTLREGYDMVDFSFTDTDGRVVSSSDKTYRGKPLMVQIMGSWCPNCVDETRLLNEVYTKYHERGLEVLAIAFEKYEDPEVALRGLRRFKETLGVQYPLLYGGSASKEEASRKLPFLDRLMSYPTCIFIDRSGVVRRIRTGFYGPGTGAHYDHYKSNLDQFITSLLDEPLEAKH